MSYFQTTTDVVEFVLELLLSVVEMLLLLRLYKKVYGKPRIPPLLLSTTAVALILSATSFMRMIVQYYQPAAWQPVTVLCSLLYLWVYPPAQQKKMLYSSIILTISCLWLLVWDLITSPIPYDQKNPWLILLSGHFIFWGMLEVIRRTDKGKSYKIPNFLWLLLASITLLSMAVFTVIEYYVVKGQGGYLLTYEVPVTIVFLFINMSLFVFFDRFASLLQIEWENGMLEQQLALQNKHYKELEASQEKIRELHHEMNNYVSTASRLAASAGDGDELREFLHTATRQLKDIDELISTGNRYLDSILNIKLEELREINCRVELDIHVPAQLKLTFEQTVTILGNLLDNATEAVKKLPEQERWLKLHLSYADGVLFIRTENASLPVVSWQEGLPQSTKENPQYHGLGLKNVKKLVDTIGTMEVESQADSFTVRIVLYDR